MQIKAVALDVIHIEINPGELVSIEDAEGGLKIKTATSAFFLKGGKIKKIK
jgi:hypothetical protein